jgi:hypothetical protein
LAYLRAFVLAERALETALVDADPGEALVAPPPAWLDITLLAPLDCEWDTAFVNVLAMELPIMLTAVIKPVEWRNGSAAARVVAEPRLLVLIWAMDLKVVSVEVGRSVERLRIAALMKTDEGQIAFGSTNPLHWGIAGSMSVIKSARGLRVELTFGHA